jgi:hypothetical protein
MNRTYPRDHRGPGPYHRLQAPGPTIETNPRLPPPLSNIGAILAIAWPGVLPGPRPGVEEKPRGQADPSAGCAHYPHLCSEAEPAKPQAEQGG